MGGLQVWHWVVIGVVIVLLFGSKRLPDAARGLGRSMRILKAETKGLMDEDKDKDKDADKGIDAAAHPQTPPAQPPAHQPPASQRDTSI